MKFRYSTKWGVFSLLAVIAFVPAFAQTFSSGSTGADGALNLSTPGTVVFDPKTFTPPLDPDGDGIYNFTTITIGAGVTVRLRGDVIAAPVVWLAQGAVQIAGTIDASGQDGFSAGNTTQRTNTIPGAGGYPGGYPGVGANLPGAGLGPAGGGACPPANVPVPFARPGGFTGNQFAVPLIGGSGGGGYAFLAGGAGGGALLIASSVSISGSGSIKANGGANVNLSGNALSGLGAGGSIRLVAPSFSLTGNLNAAAGAGGFNSTCGPSAGTTSGVIRVEAFQIGPINATGTLYTATPFGLFLSPAGIPSLRVVSVGGIPVATSPTGTFTIPDVTVNSNLPLPVVIAATNVTVGTIVTLTIFSENGPDLTIQSTPLAGALAASTATANVTLPPGFSKGFVKATFIQ